MHWYNKVAWSEGLFLRPQLFQQQERYLENFAHRRAAGSGPFFWGFRKYQIDTSSLALGKVALASAEGMFADGTPFATPADTVLPPPFTVGQEHTGKRISLAVQSRSVNGEESNFDPAGSARASSARFGVIDVELRDSNSFGQGSKPTQLQQLRLHLLPDTDAQKGWLILPIARVAHVAADGGVTLDADFIAPVSSFSASLPLSAWLTNLHSICRQRAEALAERLSASSGRVHAAAEVADFLLLQILNRHDVLLNHLLAVPETPPEQFYLLLSALGAELATFLRPGSRRPNVVQPYRHEGLQDCLQPLCVEVQALLNQVLVRSARQITLVNRPDGVCVANVPLNELKGFASLVFAVAADMPPDRLASDFPQHCKVAPQDQLHELIRAHVPGIPLQLLPVPPRQIPFNAGFVYFQLEPRGPLWDHLLSNGGLGLHMGTEFPGMRLELWGVAAA